MVTSVLVFLALSACVAAVDPPWWRTATIYEIYLRSFRDSDGDGIGDLKGVTEKAQHFKDLGVDAVWLTPLYPSPMVDFGYDISNYTGVEPMFGTMADFEQMVDTLQKLDIKVVMDFVPNHSSDQHPWFQASRDPLHPLHTVYRDFYVWVDPPTYLNGTPTVPNNWMSVFGGSSWTFIESRKQFYYHQFTPQQPDLNFNNRYVVGNITQVLDYWMDKGVAGLRIDAAGHLFENTSWPSEPPLPGTAGDDYFTLNHIYTADQPKTYELLLQWAKFVVDRKKDGQERFIILETFGDLNTEMKYFGSGELSMEMPFNFGLLGLDQANTSVDFKSLIDLWTAALPKDGTSSWVLGTHDFKLRLPDHFGPELVDAMNILTAVLPGIRVIYYGEELGMSNSFVRWDQTKDPIALKKGPNHFLEWDRDPLRTPMQWDDSRSAGFSRNLSTWLPVNPDYWKVNVQSQLADPNSHLSVCKALGKERKSATLKLGTLDILTPDNYTLVVVRSLNESHYALVINMGSEESSVVPRALLKTDTDWTVAVASGGAGLARGATVLSSSVMTLRPKQAVLLRTDSSASGSSAASGPFASGLLLCTLASLLLKSWSSLP